MAKPTTVFERSQSNGGFIAGPKHSLLGDSSAAVGASKPKADAPAPNYRTAEEIGRDCEACAHLSEDQKNCTKFSFAPKLFKVCDEFAEAGVTDAAPPPVSDLPGSDDTAWE